MKSHVCHVFIQRLIALAFHDMLPKPIWRVLKKLSLPFKDICPIRISISIMDNVRFSITEKK